MKATGDADISDGITLEYELDATTEKVWRALTVPEIVEEWLGTNAADSRDRGRSYTLVDAEPYTRVRYALHDPATEPADTVVTFEIAPREHKTVFRIIHTPQISARTHHAQNGNGPPLSMAA